MNDETFKPFLFSKFIFRLFLVISLVVFYKTIQAYNFSATQMSGTGTVFIISFLNPFLGLIAGYLFLLPHIIYRKFKKLPPSTNFTIINIVWLIISVVPNVVNGLTFGWKLPFIR